VKATMIRLPEEMLEALQAEASRSGVSMSELVRQAITLRLALVAVDRAAAEGRDIGKAITDALRQLGR
jgi:predicted DNA-binding protein